ncbi:MAG: tetratricopeptide repeat protein [Acidiferrobacterales bacterium]
MGHLIVSPLLIFVLLAGALSPMADEGSPRAPQLLADQRYREEKEILEETVRANRNDAAARYDLGRTYLALCAYDDAIEQLKQAVWLAQDKALYHFWLGRAYGEKAKRANPFKQASLAGEIRKEFERAVVLEPRNVDARNALGNFYAQAPSFMGGGTKKARAQAKALTELDALKGKLLYARIDEQGKETARAFALYEELEQRYATSAGAAVFYGAYGQFLRRQRRYDEAIKAFTKQLELDPHNLSARLRLAAVYATVDRLQDAASEYKKVAAVSRGCVPVKYRRGRPRQLQ